MSHLVVAESSAEFSPCRRYRYSLRHTFADGRAVMFVGLNPSTADESTDDPTIRRCLGFAKRWGYGTLIMANLYAWRATDPRELAEVDWPVGEPNCDGGGTVNDARLYRLGREANLVVAAWGADPAALDRGRYVRGLLGDCVALGLTKHGQPRHPLYVRADVVPVPYPGGPT